MRFLWIVLAILFALAFIGSVIIFAFRPSVAWGIIAVLCLAAAIYFGQKK